MNLKRAMAVAVLSLGSTIFASPAANADVIWTVTGNFNDGGTVNGTFDINVYGYLEGYNLVTTAGTIDPGFDYTPADSYFSNGTFYVDAQPSYEADLHLTFLGNLSVAVADNPIIGGLGGPSWECIDLYSCYIPEYGDTRYIANGFASAPVPEPITLSLFGTGLVGAIAMRRRKKKVA